MFKIKNKLNIKIIQKKIHINQINSVIKFKKLK